MKTTKLFRSIIASLFLVLCASASAQSLSSVKGLITDAATGEPLFGVAVQIDGTSKGAFSDLDGNYELKEVGFGTVNLKFSLLSYQSKVITGVEVKSSQPVQVDVVLDAELMEMATTDDAPVVVGFKDRSNVASVITDIRTANGVSSGVGQAQIQKGNDNNAGEVARRIPGVT
ncbi:MAG: carboxypeptidase-like regulatory domain-containing protein, partial [Flavobacteriales bacterium]|nr:carboxypeptidase-like regulatory domain-containing protein [Flavobacteriales bacterium]